MLVLMAAQVETAIGEANALVFVVDGRQGLPIDQVIWHQIRRSGMTVFVAVNKIDTPAADSLVSDFYGLGAQLYPMTAEGGSGVELLDALVETIPMPTVASDDGRRRPTTDVRYAGSPFWAGRTSAESTLANALLGKERFLTSDVGNHPGRHRYRLSLERPEVRPEVDTANRASSPVERGVERMRALPGRSGPSRIAM